LQQFDDTVARHPWATPFSWLRPRYPQAGFFVPEHPDRTYDEVFKFVTAVALCAVFGAQARTFDEVKKDGKILMATEGQFALQLLQGHELTGFEVELAELVAKKMG
jgi:hypothetical protein